MTLLAPSPIARPGRRRATFRAAWTGLALLLLIGTEACWIPHQLTSGCRTVARSPLRLGVELAGPEHYNRRARMELRDAIYLTLYERGLRLNFNNPYYEWCTGVSEPKLQAWLDNAEILRGELHRYEVPPAEAEILGLSYGTGPEARGGLVTVDELTAAGLEAARNLLCLGREAFGTRVVSATLEITPELAARVGFPGTCESPPRSGGAAIDTWRHRSERGRHEP